jgi:hypothetical protein
METASSEIEVVAQELSVIGQKLSDFERRMAEVERVNSRLEEAALTTARALQEIRVTGTRSTRRCDARTRLKRRPSRADSAKNGLTERCDAAEPRQKQRGPQVQAPSAVELRPGALRLDGSVR